MDKNIYKFIFYLLVLASFESYGQFMFIDDFENGQWGNWENTAHWTISDQSAIAGKHSLRHNLTGLRSSSFINRKITPNGFNNGLVTWKFKLKTGNWIFGATEQVCFFLISDKSDIPTSNGYAIGINLIGGDNNLKLCRMENGRAVQEIVMTDLAWKAGQLLEVEVSHEYGLWTVRYKEGGAITWSAEKTGNEKLLNFTFDNIGTSFKFNTAHGGQVWMDDISMDFQNRSPSIHEVQSIGRNQLLILFSESMAQIPLLQTDNYHVKTIDGASINVISVRKAAGDTAGVYLQLGNFNQWNLHMTVNSLTDNEGMALSDNEIDFGFIPTAQFGDIVFNELMADPTPVVKLPNAEFIELKNISEFPIGLNNWRLEVNGKLKVLSEKTMSPGSFLMLCGTGGNSVFENYGANLELPGLSIANDGVILKLYSDSGVLIDSLSYKPTMHRKGFTDGGYSLERIDPMRKCGAELNWETTISDNGGTPGSINSIFAVNLDISAPTINFVIASSRELLEIGISEMTDAFSITGNIFTFSLSLPSPDSIRFDRKLLKYSIYFQNGSIKNGVNYELTINGLADECGNKSPVEHREFWYYLPGTGDLLISEVLFNPLPDGVDFVEIYNCSGRKVEMADIYLASRDNNQIIKSGYPLSTKSAILFDAQYAAFTSDTAVLVTDYYSACPECIFEMEKFPAYNLDEGWVVLMNKEKEIIDEFHYLENMHHSMINDVKGISLERNSFFKSSGDPLNWHSASKTVGFATPGYRNSTADISTESHEIVSVENKIFSPNDDGLNDRLLIKLSPGEPGWMVNIRIYNESGSEIKRLANNLMIGAQDIVEWDGTVQNHQKASLGIYVIRIEIFSLHGGRKQFKAACVLTDRLE